MPGEPGDELLADHAGRAKDTNFHFLRHVRLLSSRNNKKPAVRGSHRRVKGALKARESSHHHTYTLIADAEHFRFRSDRFRASMKETYGMRTPQE
jgi:hypothetical protein